MKLKHFIICTVLLFIIACGSTKVAKIQCDKIKDEIADSTTREVSIKNDAIRITGGKLIEVVVRSSGNSDSTFYTLLHNGVWPMGPSCIDIDNNQSVYVKGLGAEIRKFDVNGKWIAAIKMETGNTLRCFDVVVVDNRGNFYTTDCTDLKDTKVVKYSPQGRLLSRTEKELGRKHVEAIAHIGDYSIVDKDGMVYNIQDHSDSFKVVIFDSNLQFKAAIYKSVVEYDDIGITQKEVGNDMYFRGNQYLLRTNLEKYALTHSIDTVASLPEELLSQE